MAEPAAVPSAFSVSSFPPPVQPYAQSLLNDSCESPSAAYDALEGKIRSHWLCCLEDFTTDQLQALFSSVWRFSVFVLQLHEEKFGVLIRKLPFLLLEDAAATLGSTKLLQFWESAVDTSTLCAGPFWHTTATSSHVLQWIRACNAVLHKLSLATTTSQSAAKGRILMDLAQVLPLNDRSSLKQWGSISHIHDGTSEAYYQEQEDYDQDIKEMKLTSDAATLSNEKTDQHFQYSIYETFWSVQKDFANPYAISFTTFLPNMRTILATLESQSVLSKSRGSAGAATTSSTSTSTLEYLTHGRLLPIQLQDPLFCRHILTQFLIVEAFVSSQSTQLQATLRDLTVRAKALLENSGGSSNTAGKQHLQTLQWLLTERESMWRNWKKNKCKPDIEIIISNEMEADPSGSDKKNLWDRPLGGNAAGADMVFHDKPLSMDELAVISKGMSESIPDVYTFLEDYVDALDPDAGIEKEYHPKNDKLFSWRALRLLSRGHLPVFDMVQKSNGDFERMVRHIYQKEKQRDIPGQAPEEETLVDYDKNTATKSTGRDNAKQDSDLPTEENDESAASTGDKESEEEEGEEASTGSPEAADQNLNEFEKAALEEEHDLLDNKSDDKRQAKTDTPTKEEGDHPKKTETKSGDSRAEDVGIKRKRSPSKSPEPASRGIDNPRKVNRTDDHRGGGGGDHRGGRGGGRGGAARGRRHPNFEPARRPVPGVQNALPPPTGRNLQPTPQPPARDGRRGGDEERYRQTNNRGRRGNRRRTY